MRLAATEGDLSQRLWMQKEFEREERRKEEERRTRRMAEDLERLRREREKLREEVRAGDSWIFHFLVEIIEFFMNFRRRLVIFLDFSMKIID